MTEDTGAGWNVFFREWWVFQKSLSLRREGREAAVVAER